MDLIKKMATAGAVAVVGLGLGAASASAYSISGGSYTGTATGTHTFTVGGGIYTISCSSATFSGTATGAATTAFTPSYSGCTFFGFPATVTQDGPWSIEVTSDDGAPTWYYGTIDIPSTTSTTISVPIAGCNVTVTGTQVFEHGENGNVGQAMNFDSGTGIELEALVNGITYTASGCPFSSGTDGTYDTNGPVSIPGITVS